MINHPTTVTDKYCQRHYHSGRWHVNRRSCHNQKFDKRDGCFQIKACFGMSEGETMKLIQTNTA